MSEVLDKGIIEISIVKANIGKMVTLRRFAEDATEDYNEAVKLIAGKAGVKESALKKFVTARASDKYEEKKAECGQLHLLFEELPQ